MPIFKTDLPKTLQMEEYQRAYVYALSSYCGWNFEILSSPDYDGIDVRLSGRYKDHNGDEQRAGVDVQLKSTASLIVDGEYLKYELEVKNHNKLCGKAFITPRYLFILDVDADSNNWIKMTDESLVLHKKCYWVSLIGQPPSPNKYRVTIRIPKNQILNRESLNEIMRKSAQGGVL